MLDMFNTPGSPGMDIQIFTDVATVTNTQWKTWRKPRGISMCYMFLVGGGGGAGGGFTRVAGAAGGGGGGGGSSAITRVWMPAIFLPDILYVQVGAGGKGVGSGGGTAGSGILSYVAVYPNTTANNVIAVSGAAPAVGGGTGTGAALGAAGTAGTIATIGAMPLAGMGSYAFIAGQIGVQGGAITGGAGTSVTIPVTSVLTMGGCGGGGTTSADFAGGAINATANTFLSEIRPIGAAAGSNSGAGGFLNAKPWFSFCGSGGGSSNTGVGGNGGNGGPGSGGGGGGAGTTGGVGGNGGNGIVYIICW